MAKDRGLFGNSLRISPPMFITKDHADYMAECLDEVMTLLESRD